MRKRRKATAKTMPKKSFFIVLATFVGMLLYALIAAQTLDYDYVDRIQLHHWFYHYQYGYIHRGLLGSILAFFDVQNQQWILHNIPRIESPLIIISMILFSVLAIYGIGRNFTPLVQMPLLAFLGVLLFAPVWKNSMILDGFVEDYIYLCVLLACASFLFRRPLCFVVFLFIGMLIGRHGIIFAMSMSLIVMHAVWRIPEYRKQKRYWLAAVAAQPLFFIVILLLHDGNIAEQVLVEAGLAEAKIESLDTLRADTLQVGTNKVWFLLHRILLFPTVGAGALLAISLPPLLLALLLSFLFAKFRLTFPSSAAAKISDWLLPVAVSFMQIPLLLYVSDFSRILYWTWQLLALVFLYYVWCMHFSGAATPQRRAKANNKSLLARISTAILLMIAFLYAGMPNLQTHLVTTKMFSCIKYCIPGITEHKAGVWIAQTIERTMNDSMFPVVLNAARFQRSLGYPDQFEIKDNALLIPSNYLRRIHYVFNPEANKPQMFTYRVSHRYSDGRLRLLANKKEIAPVVATDIETEWQLAIPPKASVRFELMAATEADVELLSIYVNAEYIQ